MSSVVPHIEQLVHQLHLCIPPVVRWGGAIARRMRQYNIALDEKKTGSSNTDALTLADLTVQELIVGALRDSHPMFLSCRIEAEETTGDLARFATESPYTICIDPIDGTKQYRDRTGNGWAIIVTLRSVETLHYTLVFVPESGPDGTWVAAWGNQVVVGPDDPSRSAVDVLNTLPVTTRESWLKTPAGSGKSTKMYMIGFQKHDPAKAQILRQHGLEGVAADDCPGCPYELIARGEYAGSLIHSPNVYDFPASLHIARLLGGDSRWVDTRRSVNFEKTWLDERAKMLRLPGIVATSPHTHLVDQAASIAANWNPVRYAE